MTEEQWAADAWAALMVLRTEADFPPAVLVALDNLLTEAPRKTALRGAIRFVEESARHGRRV